MYLVATIDWYSRYVLGWRLSNTLDGSFCLEMLEECLGHGRPHSFNTDQGTQFSAAAWTGRLEPAGVAVSMEGRGRWLDNVFVERLWRTVNKDETIPSCLHTRCRGPYNRHHLGVSVGAARTGELVPRPDELQRRIRTMPRPQPLAAPPRP